MAFENLGYWLSVSYLASVCYVALSSWAALRQWKQAYQANRPLTGRVVLWHPVVAHCWFVRNRPYRAPQGEDVSACVILALVPLLNLTVMLCHGLFVVSDIALSLIKLGILNLAQRCGYPTA